jgi:beta-glucosidase
MIVVVMASKPQVLPPIALTAEAIVWAASPGMLGGTAIAELLFGAIEPSGRLPVSFPRHAGQLPVFYNQIRGQHGHRYADLTQDPAFAFGEGLSYSTVEYRELSLRDDVVGRDGVVRAEVVLRNAGRRPALETVQAYVSDLVTSVTWAVQELKAYRQVEVAPGQQITVAIDVAVADCSIVDAAGRRVVEPGEFELRVGPSSRLERQLRARFTVQD